MTSGSKKALILGLLFAAAVVAFLVMSSLHLAQYKAEVCIDFNGRSQCRTAAGSTEEFALRSATTDACSTLAGGVTEVMACEHSTPTSVRWLKRP